MKTTAEDEARALCRDAVGISDHLYGECCKSCKAIAVSLQAKNDRIAELESWQVTHPAYEVLESRLKIMREALKEAEQFIINGIDCAYIEMPRSEDDPAWKTLPNIQQALAECNIKNE